MSPKRIVLMKLKLISPSAFYDLCLIGVYRVVCFVVLILLLLLLRYHRLWCDSGDRKQFTYNELWASNSRHTRWHGARWLADWQAEA